MTYDEALRRSQTRTVPQFQEIPGESFADSLARFNAELAALKPVFEARDKREAQERNERGL